MTRGGIRPNAGRPLKGSSPAIARTIRVNQEDWDQIALLAQEAGLSVTQYILRSTLPQQDLNSPGPQQNHNSSVAQ